jgi:RNA polymerase sigma factor (sigma-70 family)
VTPPADAPVLTVQQHLRLRTARHIVERAAKQVARRSSRFLEEGDLLSIGTIALYAAVCEFNDAYSHSFVDYAEHYVRGAMLKAVEAESFQDRVRRAVDIAAEHYWAYLTDREYNAAKHDDREARRRFRAIANGMLSAAFMAGVEEAERATPETDRAARQEYEVAIQVLRAGLDLFPEPEHKLLVLLYRERRDLKEASALLGVAYSTIRRRHAAALERLRKHLVSEGVKRAPPPLDLPEGGNVLVFRKRRDRDDDDDPEGEC